MKKPVSLLLAFLLLSALLVAPAGAASVPSTAAGLAAASIDLQGTHVEAPVTLWTGSASSDAVSSDTLTDHWVVQSDAPITLRNIGSSATAYIYVYLREFAQVTAPIQGTAVDESTGEAQPVTIQDGYYYNGVTYYLTTPEKAASFADSRTLDAGDALCWAAGQDLTAIFQAAPQHLSAVYAGDSLTFRLPTGSKESLYQLSFQVYYPEYHRSYYRCSYLTVDDAQAAEAPAPVYTKRFTDVEQGAYFFEAVSWAVDRGITNGITDLTFIPHRTCTNAHIITFLWRANGTPAVDEAAPFPSIPEDAYYLDAVNWAYSQGIIDDSFDPQAPCTRADAVTYLYRNAGQPEVTYSGRFTDVSSTDAYAGAVQWAYDQGITNGASKTAFAPNSTCTRAQIVSFLYRGLNV